ncbi:unnamed protein product, partial [Phaeothamnion confervicola]
SRSGNSGVAGSTAVSSSTASSTLPPETAAAAAPATILVDPSTYVGRDHKAVAEELRALGFVVEERPVKGNGAKKNTVVSVEPSGQLVAGARIVIGVAKAGHS